MLKPDGPVRKGLARWRPHEKRQSAQIAWPAEFVAQVNYLSARIVVKRSKRLRPNRSACADQNLGLRQHPFDGDSASKISEVVIAAIFGRQRSHEWHSSILRRGPAVNREV